MKVFWTCNTCNEVYPERQIAEIIYETEINYRGIDATVVCKKCSKNNKRGKK